MNNDEEAITTEILEDNVRLMQAREGSLLRAQHAKGHGCVRATFTVREDISDPALKVGLFSKPKSYDAVIRFSNAKKLDDREKDAHGMAIKLLGVPGEKLHPGHETRTTFDFVMIDHPVMFAANLEEYRAISELLDDIGKHNVADEDEYLLGRAGKILGKVSEAIGAVREGSLAMLPRLLKFRTPMPMSPVARSYWSQTPYKLGEDHAVKYVARTHRSVDENALGEALARELSATDARFTFGIHVQRDANTHPIEDATVPWWPDDDEGGLETMIPVADIQITGFVEDSELMAENLVFSAWNVTEAHEPLGGLNRVRRTIYADLATKRHAYNATSGKCPFAATDFGSTDYPS